MKAIVELNSLFETEVKSHIHTYLSKYLEAAGCNKDIFMYYNGAMTDAYVAADVASTARMTDFYVINYTLKNYSISMVNKNTITNKKVIKTDDYGLEISTGVSELEEDTVSYTFYSENQSIVNAFKANVEANVTGPEYTVNLKLDFPKKLKALVKHYLKIKNITEGTTTSIKDFLEAGSTLAVTETGNNFTVDITSEAKLTMKLVNVTAAEKLTNDMYKVKADFKLKLTRPNLILVEYPLMINNKQLDKRLIGFRSKYITNQAGIVSPDILTPIGTDFQTYRGLDDLNFVKSPPVDNFKIPVSTDYAHVASILLQLDKAKPKTLGNLFDFTDFKFLEPYHKFLKDNLDTLLTGNLFKLTVFKDDTEVTNININSTGNLTSTTNLDIKSFYRVIISIRKNYDSLPQTIRTSLEESLKPYILTFVNSGEYLNSNLFTYTITNRGTKDVYTIDTKGNIKNEGMAICYSNGAPLSSNQNYLKYAEWYKPPVNTLDNLENEDPLTVPTKYFENDKPVLIDGDWVLYKGFNFHKTIANRNNVPATKWTKALDDMTGDFKIRTTGLDVYIWDKGLAPGATPEFTAPVSNLLKAYNKLTLTDHKIEQHKPVPYLLINDIFYKIEEYTVFEPVTKEDTGFKLVDDNVNIQPSQMSAFFKDGYIYLNFGLNARMGKFKIKPITGNPDDHKLAKLTEVLFKSAKLPRLTITGLPPITADNIPANGWYSVGYAGEHDFAFVAPEWAPVAPHFMIHKLSMDYEDPTPVMIAAKNKITTANTKLLPNSDLKFYVWETDKIGISNPPIYSSIGDVAGLVNKARTVTEKEIKYLNINNKVYKVVSSELTSIAFNDIANTNYKLNSDTERVFPSKSMLMLNGTNPAGNRELTVYTSCRSRCIKFEIEPNSVQQFDNNNDAQNYLTTLEEPGVILLSSVITDELATLPGNNYIELSRARVAYDGKIEDPRNPTEQDIPIIPVPEDSEIWRKYKKRVYVHRTSMNKDNSPVHPDMTEVNEILNKRHDIEAGAPNWYFFKPSKLPALSDIKFNDAKAGKFKYPTYVQDVRAKVEEIKDTLVDEATGKVGNIDLYSYIAFNNFWYKVKSCKVYQQAAMDNAPVNSNMHAMMAKPYLSIDADDGKFIVNVQFGLTEWLLRFELEPVGTDDYDKHVVNYFNLFALKDMHKDQKLLNFTIKDEVILDQDSLTGQFMDYQILELECQTIEKGDNQFWRPKVPNHVYMHYLIMNRDDNPKTPESLAAETKYNVVNDNDGNPVRWFVWRHKDLTSIEFVPFEVSGYGFDYEGDLIVGSKAINKISDGKYNFTSRYKYISLAATSGEEVIYDVERFEVLTPEYPFPEDEIRYTLEKPFFYIESIETGTPNKVHGVVSIGPDKHLAKITFAALTDTETIRDANNADDTKALESGAATNVLRLTFNTDVVMPILRGTLDPTVAGKGYVLDNINRVVIKSNPNVWVPLKDNMLLGHRSVVNQYNDPPTSYGTSFLNAIKDSVKKLNMPGFFYYAWHNREEGDTEATDAYLDVFDNKNFGYDIFSMVVDYAAQHKDPAQADEMLIIEPTEKEFVKYISLSGYWYKVQKMYINTGSVGSAFRKANTDNMQPSQPIVQLSYHNKDVGAGTEASGILKFYLGYDLPKLTIEVDPILETDQNALAKVTDVTDRSEAHAFDILRLTTPEEFDNLPHMIVMDNDHQVRANKFKATAVGIENIERITVPPIYDMNWYPYNDRPATTSIKTVYIHGSIGNADGLFPTESKADVDSIIPPAYNTNLYIWSHAKVDMTSKKATLPFTGGWDQLGYKDLVAKLKEASAGYTSTIDGIEVSSVLMPDHLADSVIFNGYVYQPAKFWATESGYLAKLGKDEKYSIVPDKNAVKFSIYKFYERDTKEYIRLDIFCGIKEPMVTILLKPIREVGGVESTKEKLLATQPPMTGTKHIEINVPGISGPIVCEFENGVPTDHIADPTNEFGWYPIDNLISVTRKPDNAIWRAYEGYFFHRGVMNLNNDPETPYMLWYKAINPKPIIVLYSTSEKNTYYGYDSTMVTYDEIPKGRNLDALDTAMESQTYTGVSLIYVNDIPYKVTNKVLKDETTTGTYRFHPNVPVMSISTVTGGLEIKVYSPKLNKTIVYTVAAISTDVLADYEDRDSLFVTGLTGRSLALVVHDSVGKYVIDSTTQLPDSTLQPGNYELNSYSEKEIKDSRPDWVQLKKYKDGNIWASKYGCFPGVAKPNDILSILKAKDYNQSLHGVDKVLVYNEIEKNKVTKHEPIPSEAGDYRKNIPEMIKQMDGWDKKYIIFNKSIYLATITRSEKPWSQDNNVISSLAVDANNTNIKVALNKPCWIVNDDINNNTLYLYIHHDAPIYTFTITYLRDVEWTNKEEFRKILYSYGTSKHFLQSTPHADIGTHNAAVKFNKGIYSFETFLKLDKTYIPPINLIDVPGATVDFGNNKIYHPLVGGLEITDPNVPRDIKVTVKRDGTGLPYFVLSPYTVVLNGVVDEVTKVTFVVKDPDDNVVYTYDQLPPTNIHNKEFEIHPTVEEILAFFKDGDPIQRREFSISGKIKGTVKEAPIIPTTTVFDFKVGKAKFELNDFRTQKAMVYLSGVSGANSNNTFLAFEYVSFHLVELNKDTGNYKTVYYKKETNDSSAWRDLAPGVVLVDNNKYKLQGELKYKYLDPIPVDPIFFIKSEASIGTPTIYLEGIDKINDRRLDLRLSTSGMSVTNAGTVTYKFVTTKWRIREKESGNLIYEADVDKLQTVVAFKGYNSDPVPTNRDNLNFEYGKTYIVEAALVADPILESPYGRLEVTTGTPPTPYIPAMEPKINRTYDEDTDVKEITCTLDPNKFRVVNRIDQTHTATSWKLCDRNDTVLKEVTKSVTNKLEISFVAGEDGVPDLKHEESYYIYVKVYSGDLESPWTYGYAPYIANPYKAPDRQDSVYPVIEITSVTPTTVSVRLKHPGDGPIDRWEFRVTGLDSGGNGSNITKTYKTTEGPFWTFEDLIPDNDYEVTGAIYFKSGVTKNGVAFGATYTYDARPQVASTPHQDTVDRNVTYIREAPNTDTTDTTKISWYEINSPYLPLAKRQYWELRKGDRFGPVVNKVICNSAGQYWEYANFEFTEYEQEFCLVGWLEFKTNGKSGLAPVSNKAYKTVRSGRLTFEVIGSGIESGNYTTISSPLSKPEIGQYLRRFMPTRNISESTTVYRCDLRVDPKWWSVIDDIQFEAYQKADPEYEPKGWMPLPKVGSGELKEQLWAWVPWGYSRGDDGKEYNYSNNVRVVITLYNGLQKIINYW